MSIEGLAQVASRGGETKAASDNKIMGKNDFLNLLVAQLQSQDPLNPMDSTAFTAQLAQFSSLEQLQNINASLGSINSSQSVMTNSQAVGFIGKTIMAVGNSIEVQDGQSQKIEFSLERDAAGSYLRVYDPQGNFIRQIESGALSAGQHQISWDGRDYLGGRSPDGAYTFEVAAIDDLGNSIPATQFASGVVAGVHFSNGQAYLQSGSREIPMGNVIRVLQSDEK
ncbi:MAG: flagellar hook assembly protein FlgD [Desulfobacteraceae bacterium]|nr:MAG: flagellar hook assembly protein FlgD [Desulfobacteraceae bacterium]